MDMEVEAYAESTGRGCEEEDEAWLNIEPYDEYKVLLRRPFSYL